MPRETTRVENDAQSRRALLAFAPAIAVLLVGLVAFDAERQAQVLNTEVTHARNVVDATASTFSALQDAETGQRGFVITGKADYLQPYTHAMDVLRSDTTALRALLSDDVEQARRLDTLDALVTEKQRELAGTIRARRNGGFAAAEAIVARDSGKTTMDSIRALLSRFDVSERATLEARRASEARHRTWARVSLGIGTILAVIIALLVNRALVGYAAREDANARELAERNRLLEDQGVELETQAQQLQDQAMELEAQKEEKVTQILLNLLSNAIKFTPRDGTISVSSAAEWREERAVVAIRVRDTGPGIAPEMLESIFDPFVQVDAKRTRNVDGTGLGLAIARELARNMGGNLACESVVGDGATFTLTLPASFDDAVVAHRPSRAGSLS